jgi:acetyl-CoA C-acetyltransferase
MQGGAPGGREPGKAWRRPRRNLVQERIDALEPPPFCLKPDGPATVETYTVLHDRPDGVPWPVIVARLDSGERCLATTPRGSDLAGRMEEEEFIGCRGVVTPGEGGPNLFR